MSNTYLMFGLNKYPGAPLNGCVNDVLDMRGDLVDMKYFKCIQGRLYKDEQCTTERVLDRLRWIVDTVKAGEIGYIHYSGHGAQTDDRNEKDGLAEILCTIDFDWSPKHMVTDDQLVAIFSKIKPGAKITFVVDSCHSGDIIQTDRDMFKQHNPIVIPRMYPGSKIRKPGQKMKTIHNTLKASGMNIQVLSACTSAQTSADTVIGGKSCGAFTYYFRQALKAAPSKTVVELVKDAHTALHAAGYEQNPTADGARIDVPLLK